MSALAARPDLLAAARQRYGLARDLPILFSAPMIAALLADRKTQTRRILKLGDMLTPDPSVWEAKLIDGVWRFVADATDLKGSLRAPVRFDVGDRLWVRETCWILGRWHKNGKTKSGRTKWRFKEDPSRQVRFEAPVPTPIKRTVTQFWRRNSIHMPRWASRLTLPVTDVQVQRLHDLNHADALSEGVTWSEEHKVFLVPGVAHPNKQFPVLSRTTAREMYAALWDAINGSGSWLGNPWVVAVSFTIQLRNIDA